MPGVTEALSLNPPAKPREWSLRLFHPSLTAGQTEVQRVICSRTHSQQMDKQNLNSDLPDHTVQLLTSPLGRLHSACSSGGQGLLPVQRGLPLGSVQGPARIQCLPTEPVQCERDRDIRDRRREAERERKTQSRWVCVRSPSTPSPNQTGETAGAGEF